MNYKRRIKKLERKAGVSKSKDKSIICWADGTVIAVLDVETREKLSEEVDKLNKTKQE
jgi:hypothetical protein